MTAAEVQILGSKCREYTGKVVKLKFNNFDDGMQNIELPSVIKVYYYSTKYWKRKHLQLLNGKRLSTACPSHECNHTTLFFQKTSVCKYCMFHPLSFYDKTLGNTQGVEY